MCPALAKPKSEKAKAFPRHIFFPQSNLQVESFKESFNSGILHSLLLSSLTKTFPKLYSALSVNFSLFSLDCPFFLEKNMKLFWFSSWKFMLSNLTWFSLLLCTLLLCTLNLLEIPMWISYIVFFKNSFIFLELTELPFLQNILLPPGLEKFKATCKSPSSYYFFPQSFLFFFIRSSALVSEEDPFLLFLDWTRLLQGLFSTDCTLCPGNPKFLGHRFLVFFWS